jgi:hypothetical protein
VGLILNLLLSLGFAAAAGAAVQAWRRHLADARREGMRALAARRGWALMATEERLGRVGTLRLSPRGGLPWVAEARPKDGPTPSATLYEAEAPRWAEGRLVLMLGSAADLRALREALGDEAGLAALPRVEGPEGLVALSDGAPPLRVDLALLSQVLRSWVPVAQGVRGRPVMILSPEGFRLRLSHPIRRPEQMERFLDLALELSRLIGP